MCVAGLDASQHAALRVRGTLEALLVRDKRSLETHEQGFFSTQTVRELILSWIELFLGCYSTSNVLHVPEACADRSIVP